MKKLYLLDRNIVDLIDKHNRKATIPDLKRINKLNKLKELDVKGSVFSPLLSIIEGKIKRQQVNDGSYISIKQSSEELVELINSETAIIDTFINHGETDSRFLRTYSHHLAKILSDGEGDKLIEQKEAYITLLKEKVGKLRKTTERLKSYELFKEISNDYNLFKHQPFTLFTLMYIFGSKRSSKLLKFNDPKFVAYNTIADFNHIKALNMLLYTMPLMGNISINFETLDSDIQFINDAISIQNSYYSDSESDTDNTLSTMWIPKTTVIDDEIPSTKDDIDNKELFYRCYKDFYGYDLRN
ncbi:TPA: hypothetical protein J1W37_003860 [Escherichia coli]|uniref:hypothetical protein n=1 Tax=Enterobacteriaceae TaxID=543 RepID=UPI0005A9868F|nr:MULTISPECIES: hypothetical protein [Enterobacteriaceae]MCJ2574068.1 hypothetical protein [Escherichia coli]MDI0773613.1 hypothetical protein [Escherichia coli]MEC3945303.1 hypothetical protein [Citrobacter werkmanii]HBA7045856.1 hypothetical protein [Escherichia coli]HBA7653998.1 hypothetical protein [Escherichia coli]